MIRNLLFALLVSGLSLNAAGYPARPQMHDAQNVFDGQYTAVLQESRRLWRLLPLAGQEKDVSVDPGSCAAGAAVPHGLWYVTRDGEGNLELIAPSMTELPQGSPEHFAIRSCGEDANPKTTLFVPAQAISWIAENVGAILIDD